MSHEDRKTGDGQAGDGQATDRRSFLKLAGLGTVTGGVALAAGNAPAEAADADGDASGGYRESAHVRKFYDTARF